MKTALVLLVSLAAFILATRTAHAQMQREGFTIGFALGPGQIRNSDDESIGGGALSLRLGGAVAPNLLVQADLEGVSVSEDGLTGTLDYAGASVTGFVHPRFFLTGGLGFVQFSLRNSDGDHAETDPELGIMFGLGVEAYQSRTFAMSIEVRSFGAEFGETTLTTGSLLLGFQWF
jgi:hypothetical protein